MTSPHFYTSSIFRKPWWSLDLKHTYPFRKSWSILLDTNKLFRAKFHTGHCSQLDMILQVPLWNREEKQRLTVFKILMLCSFVGKQEPFRHVLVIGILRPWQVWFLLVDFHSYPMQGMQVRGLLAKNGIAHSSAMRNMLLHNISLFQLMPRLNSLHQFVRQCQRWPSLV